MKPIYPYTATMLTILAREDLFRPHVVKAGHLPVWRAPWPSEHAGQFACFRSS
jgi:hypothetical protein